MLKTAYSHSTPKHSYHIPLSQRFPEDIECIIQSPHPERGSLYISNIQAAENPDTLKRYSIKAVLSCAKGYVLNHSKSVVPHYLYIAAVDHQDCDIYPHFDQTVNFIQKHIKTTNVLVHCLAGVSRSVSMVIAYFIRQHNLTDQQAFSLVKSRRKIINPNKGFRQQLKKYHEEVSASRSQRLIPTERLNRTPPKQVGQQYQLYKTMYLKHEKTAATEEKSIQKERRGKMDYLTPQNSRNLLLHYQQTKLAVEGHELSSSKLNRSFQTKQTLRNISPHTPHRMESDKEQREDVAPQQRGTKGYFHNMSQDLDQRIEKIKQKYQIHRQKLEQRYQKRLFDNNFELSSFTKPQSDVLSRRVERIKTQSYHEYNKKPTQQIERQKYRDLYPEFDSQLPRTLTTQVTEKDLKSNERKFGNTSFLTNDHYLLSPSRTKNEDFLRTYTYTNYRNSMNRNNYKLN